MMTSRTAKLHEEMKDALLRLIESQPQNLGICGWNSLMAMLISGGFGDLLTPKLVEGFVNRCEDYGSGGSEEVEMFNQLLDGFDPMPQRPTIETIQTDAA